MVHYKGIMGHTERRTHADRCTRLQRPKAYDAPCDRVPPSQYVTDDFSDGCGAVEAVVMKVVTDGERIWLDLRGLRTLELAS